MQSFTSDRSPIFAAAQSAFVVYKPAVDSSSESVFYNQEAWQILTYPTGKPKKGDQKPMDICDLCRKWRLVMEKRLREGGRGSGDHLDVIPSGRRKYMVRGLLLGGQPDAGHQDSYFMFMLERMSSESVNLPMIFRQWNLSPREQDLVRMLIADKSNKEIAHLLNLSLNTVKGYMKLLMRKLGVTGRAGIVACLLTKRADGAEDRPK